MSDVDDGRLLAELEICQNLERLARLRELVVRAHAILSTALIDPVVVSKDF